MRDCALKSVTKIFTLSRLQLQNLFLQWSYFMSSHNQWSFIFKGGVIKMNAEFGTPYSDFWALHLSDHNGWMGKVKINWPEVLLWKLQSKEKCNLDDLLEIFLASSSWNRIPEGTVTLERTHMSIYLKSHKSNISCQEIMLDNIDNFHKCEPTMTQIDTQTQEQYGQSWYKTEVRMKPNNTHTDLALIPC